MVLEQELLAPEEVKSNLASPYAKLPPALRLLAEQAQFATFLVSKVLSLVSCVSQMPYCRICEHTSCASASVTRPNEMSSAKKPFEIIGRLSPRFKRPHRLTRQPRSLSETSWKSFLPFLETWVNFRLIKSGHSARAESPASVNSAGRRARRSARQTEPVSRAASKL